MSPYLGKCRQCRSHNIITNFAFHALLLSMFPLPHFPALQSRACIFHPENSASPPVAWLAASHNEGAHGPAQLNSGLGEKVLSPLPGFCRDSMIYSLQKYRPTLALIMCLNDYLKSNNNLDINVILISFGQCRYVACSSDRSALQNSVYNLK